MNVAGVFEFYRVMLLQVCISGIMQYQLMLCKGGKWRIVEGMRYVCMVPGLSKDHKLICTQD